MAENPKLDVGRDNLSSNCENGGFQEKGIQKISVSDHVTGLQYTAMKPDSIVLDMERFSHIIEKDSNLNSSRITRTLSRKGSVRGGGDKKINPASANERDTSLVSTSPRAAALHGGISMPEKPTVVPVGAADHAINPQVHNQITIVNSGRVAVPAAEGKFGGRRFSFRRSSHTLWTIDPRRILMFFATLSSMGTILLIYFTLSMGKMNGADDIITSE